MEGWKYWEGKHKQKSYSKAYSTWHNKIYGYEDHHDEFEEWLEEKNGGYNGF